VNWALQERIILLCYDIKYVDDPTLMLTDDLPLTYTSFGRPNKIFGLTENLHYALKSTWTDRITS